MTKDFIYFGLMDSLEHDQCPICALINKNVNKFFDGLLYESVNDIKIREDIKRSKGYCNYHSWKLKSFGDPLAHAIIYSNLLKSLGESLEQFLNSIKDSISIKRAFLGSNKDSNINKLKSKLNGEEECPICKMIAESESQYIEAFMEFFNEDKEFNKKFVINGFCVRCI